MSLRKNPLRAEAARRFMKTLGEADIEAQLVDASDRDHGTINRRFGDPDDDRVTAQAQKFLDKQLARLRKSD